MNISPNNISVIIVTYHTGDVLFECIKSCKEMSGVGEVIIVNNGNPPEILEKLSAMDYSAIIEMLDGHGNIGFGRANNLAAKKAKGQYLLFVNPDCYSDDKDFALKLKDALEGNGVSRQPSCHPGFDPGSRNKNNDLAEPRTPGFRIESGMTNDDSPNDNYWFATSLILNSDGTIQKTCRRNLMTLSNAIVQSFGVDKILPLEKIDRDISEIEYLPSISYVPAFSGALFFCSKEKYELVGGFSEEYFLHVEDMDLSMKIHKAGGKICFVKDAVIYHKLSTSDVSSKFLEWHKAWGFVHYLNKFYPWTRIPIIKQVITAAIWCRYYVKSFFF